MTTTRVPGVAAEVIAIRPGPPLTSTVTVDGSRTRRSRWWPPRLPSAVR